MSNAIDLEKFKQEKEASEDARTFRINYFREMDAWDREAFERYTVAREAMTALFKHFDQEWRSPDDHLPKLVHFVIDSILKDCRKGR